MKLLKKAVATAAASLLLLSTTPVMAHGGHNNLIQLRAEPARLHLETHLDAATLSSFDENKDGQLTQTEFDTATARHQAMVASVFQCSQRSWGIANAQLI